MPLNSPADAQKSPRIPRLSTGITGLDDVLEGGLPEGYLYLVEGEAGAGKTTLGLQFLRAGTAQGEPVLWISLSETERQLRQAASSHNWSLEGVQLCNPGTDSGTREPYSFFSAADVELDQIYEQIVAAVNRAHPRRVIFDPFSDIRYLTRDVLRYRRFVLQLSEFFATAQCTVLLMQEMTRGTPGDLQAEALVNGYLTLHQESPEYGGQRRRLRVHKMRGSRFRDGYHDFSIETGGLVVYPRLISSEHEGLEDERVVSSDVQPLDTLLGGGVERGSSLLLLGAAGVGKSTFATQFVTAAARRGERSALFLFDETAKAFRRRSRGLSLDVKPHEASGLVTLRQVDAAELSPGQFAHLVLGEVERGAQVIVIDSLSGYLSAMPEERFLTTHLHELLTYLTQKGVLTILTLAQHGVVGDGVVSPVDVSYLADTVVMLRYFESFGTVRRAISVVKHRTGPHETSVREVEIHPGGIRIGEPLRDFVGVLSGRPQYAGNAQRPYGEQQ